MNGDGFIIMDYWGTALPLKSSHFIADLIRRANFYKPILAFYGCFTLLFKSKQVIRGAGRSIVLRIFSRIAIYLESLLILELELAMLTYWGESETVIIWYLRLDSCLELNESIVLFEALILAFSV
jgi:hypothetical protein